MCGLKRAAHQGWLSVKSLFRTAFHAVAHLAGEREDISCGRRPRLVMANVFAESAAVLPGSNENPRENLHSR